MGLLAAEGACAACLENLVDASADSLEQHYSMGDMIGEGRFSKVYSGVSVSSGKQVALKHIDIGTLEEDEEALEMLEAEVLALRRASNAAHVVRLHQVVASPDAIWLAMERVPGRELFEVVEECGALSNTFVCHLMRQLLTALTALAEVGVVHRDVKPENMMVSEEGAATPVLTLIDFGYAALLGSDSSEGGGKLTGVAGSPEYAAPEVLSWLEVEADESGTAVGEPYDAGCDVWSVGVTAHVLLCAELPFDLPEECSEEALVAAARNVDLSFRRKEWEGEAMAPARDFVQACMTVARAERPSAQQLLEHAWFGGAKPKGANAAYVEMVDEAIAAEQKAASLPGSGA